MVFECLFIEDYNYTSLNIVREIKYKIVQRAALDTHEGDEK
jgi:hypothetical protein